MPKVDKTNHIEPAHYTPLKEEFRKKWLIECCAGSTQCYGMSTENGVLVYSIEFRVTEWKMVSYVSNLFSYNLDKGLK